METIIVDAEGRIVIPAQVTEQLGVRAGARVAVVKLRQGLFVGSPGTALLEEWYDNLTGEERLEALKEAQWYESLSEAEKDALWNQGDEELARWLEEDGDEDDEIDDGYDLGQFTPQTVAR